MKKLNKKGFTLVELLAVIVILALLMVVAASTIGNVQENTKKSALKTEAQKIVTNANNDLQSAKVLGTLSSDTVKGYASGSITGTDGNFNYKLTVNVTDYTITALCITDGKYSISLPESGSTWSAPTLPATVTYGSLTSCE